MNTLAYHSVYFYQFINFRTYNNKFGVIYPEKFGPDSLARSFKSQGKREAKKAPSNALIEEHQTKP
jgi:hypothetical protein